MIASEKNIHPLLIAMVFSGCLVSTVLCHGPTDKATRGNQLKCRDRSGQFLPDDFLVSSCSMCFAYLFQKSLAFKTLAFNRSVVMAKFPRQQAPISKQTQTGRLEGEHLSRYGNGSKSEERFRKIKVPESHESLTGDTTTLQIKRLMARFDITIISPDVRDQLSLQEVLNELTDSQGYRWIQCCQDARQCCDRQMKTFKQRIMGRPDVINTCPMTWDGYSCVEETPAGKVARFQCPSFITNLKLRHWAQASRQCLTNATWWRSPVTRMEWTDYSGCLSLEMQDMKTVQLVAISCAGASIVCLIPTTIIFLCIRSLRSQLRIKIHIWLFVSALLSSIANLLWEWLAMYDRLASHPQDTLEHQSPAGCKALNVLARLTKSSTYFWMLCEGLHLQWLMLQSYKVFTNIGLFVFIGWGIPCILVLIYVIVRLAYFNDDLCWIASTGKVEWVVDGPIIACICLKVIFLFVILKTLCYQLHAHDDSLATIRKTARALFILIPMLGLQHFLILYSPSSDSDGYFAYEIVSAIIENSQGLLAALVLCAFNSEVQTQVKLTYRHWSDVMSSRRQSLTVVTSVKRQSVTSVTNKPANKSLVTTVV